MTTPQSGILPEASPAALFITLQLRPGCDLAQLRQGIAAVPRLTAELAAELDAEYPNAGLLSVVGVGADCWPKIFPGTMPAGLRPFPAQDSGGRKAPSTPADLLLHIRSARHDLNFVLARRLLDALAPAVGIVEEVQGFRYLDNRDLTGFVDGTENPKDADRARVALAGGQEGDLAGGSYIHIQRYVHDLAAWEKLRVSDQEQKIGRTKADDIEMEDDAKPPTAHISRVDIKEGEEKVEILRHSMPYGDSSTAGLYFVSYGASPRPFEQMLERMFQSDREGHYDHLIDFTTAVTGASFFAPPLEFLAAAG